MSLISSIMPDKAPPLWTRSFTTLILGSAVTMLGHALSGFAVSLLVLDYTGSVFLYSLYLAAYFLPMVVMPLLAGPLMDNFSRVKMIYGLDFIAAFFYLGAWFLLRQGMFSYWPFLAAVVVLGCIDGIYLVAYDSLFPNLIAQGNFGRGYAISSMLYPLASMMTPVAAWIYGRWGVAPLFLCNFFFFFAAAAFETRIEAPETYIQHSAGQRGKGFFLRELRSGFAYLRAEPGLMIITVYFFFTSFAGSGCSTLWLPYFKSVAALGATTYAFVQAFSVAGRFAGGLFQYRVRIPPKRKFAIALTVYASICLFDGSLLYLPLWLMIVSSTCSGLLGVTSYNIRLSTTQAYVPDELRGRFNGVFQMVTQGGTILGQLLAGALGEKLPLRPLTLAFITVNVLAVLFIMVPGRESVKAIYNREV